MNSSRKKKNILILSLFLFVFAPPFLPIPLIYLLGPLAFLYVYRKKRVTMMMQVIKQSHIFALAKLFLLMTFYIVLIGAIDMVIASEKDVISTRLRCFNQILFLSFFQFSFVAYLFYKYYKQKISFEDSMDLLVKAAFLQSCCAVMAFLLPPVRQLFVMFGDQELFTNEYFIETRGFGFSMTLIDTFGYGMGLIAGYIILFKWSKGFDKYLLLALVLILFTIAVNARTGILVFLIALAIKMFYCKSLGQLVLRLLPVTVILVASYAFLPELLKRGVESDNQTISWICFSFSSIFDLMQESNVSSSDIQELDFLSSFINLPSNPFELIFGTGHYVYDTQSSLGFRTDIGYFNMFWEFGLLGSIIIMIAMLLFMFQPFFLTHDDSIKRICLFNTVTYFMLLMKAILIGYNPGVFVNYLVTFSIYFYIWKEKNDKHNIIKIQTNE